MKLGGLHHRTPRFMHKMHPQEHSACLMDYLHHVLPLLLLLLTTIDVVT
jgi:hypothetical protein